MTGALLVFGGLVIALRLLSGGGAWQLGWGGALGVGVLLWPAVAGGYESLRRLLLSNAEEQDNEVRQTAWDAVLGLPLVGVSVAWSLLVLGLVRFIGGFDGAPRGGIINFAMSVLTLHLLAWGTAALAQWALAARRARDE